MRKFLKYIHNNYYFEINNNDNTIDIDIEDNTVIDNKFANNIIENNTIEDKTVIENHTVIDKIPKKSSITKSQRRIDYDFDNYLENFTDNTNYTNQERISVFKICF
jgi:hypothetical protein